MSPEEIEPEEFATEYERQYFNFCYALQSEKEYLRRYAIRIEDLFCELEKEMKRIGKKKISISELFSAADCCLIGYYTIIKEAKTTIVKEYCSNKLKLAKDARNILSYFLPLSTINEIFEESKSEKYHS